MKRLYVEGNYKQTCDFSWVRIEEIHESFRNLNLYRGTLDVVLLGCMCVKSGVRISGWRIGLHTSPA